MLSLTKSLCRQYNIKPTRRFGQNFLIRKNVYNKIIRFACLEKDDVILEVGPGFGFLTAKLAKKVKKVIAVELDKKLANILSLRMHKLGLNNVKVVNKDILKFDYSQYIKYKIVANLPYNITSIFLRKFLSYPLKPELMVLMLQKEVAERIIATPPQISLLAISVQFYAKPQIMAKVPAKDFWPQPKVDSAIVKLKIKKNLPPVDEKAFFEFVRAGFGAKRKMLKNNFASYYKLNSEELENLLEKVDLNKKIRAQELSLDNWLKLFGIFCQNVI